MNAFLASLRKESLLLVRDWHALLVLFAMPGLFVLIMSMALAERFEEGGVQLPGYLVVETDADSAQEFVAELQDVPHLGMTPAAAGQALHTGDALYELRLPEYFDDALEGLRDGAGIYLRFAPELSRRDRALIQAAIQEAFARYNTLGIARELGYDRDYAETELLRQGFIAVDHGELAQTPSAVQQSVSAWLIFAMFFIAIPISTTVIQERQQRTLMRLRTLGMPIWVLYSAKLFPYFVVNLLQLLVMLGIGIVLLPLLGAQGLSLAGVNLGALLVIGASTSLAALALASLIATLARSVEQATVASGALNIVFAALGGIMIPTFVMPPALQTLAQVSPMAWALDGFLDVLVRGANYGDIAGPSALLLGSAAILWLASAGLLKRGADHD
ncbi:ABC transporter permease [Marinimicrobium sp. ABcell2]|uniref:ABC transporter permease n=1 Tax=Marinimicrobium sp. ABcell2 TaxID=3069751 RepID=UPI0027AE4294|nr:ABC transporter permease [Marinimicrobium sp. ABcell2]MDQ2076981.1 ABC transporter permease [Marinimicrobium sp. ABcell2]